ncbi:PD-(D/E)XK nuclease family protein, partial [bacterium]|nr:PD-(D/E)XK nuclease family protein [bacterium]
KVPAEFSQEAMRFARRMNSYDINEAASLDGCIEDPGRLWASVLKSRGMDHLRLSYSTLKSFYICPFQFFGTVVLRLEESPKETENDEQDLDPKTKGILAETVVKEAIKYIKNSNCSIDQAVQKSAAEIREKYRDVFPPLILNLYMKKFQNGAKNLLRYLQSEGYDLKLSIVPETENKETVELIGADGNPHGFRMIISGVLDLITFKASGKNGLISDLKWGGSRTSDTPNMMHDKGELQFCLYPAMHEVSSGEFLPFRYFRLNVFEQFGDPNQIGQKLRDLGLKDAERVMRYFGGASVTAKTYTQETQYLRTRDCGMELLKAQFRILKDPAVPYSDCKYCSYTQLCRRSHAATLLRTRMADLRDKK